MGFLAEGRALSFENSKKSNFLETITKEVNVDARTVVKRDGLKQLVHILKSEKTKAQHKILLWGEELEMTTVIIPECMNRPPRLWMGGYSLVSKLQQLEKQTDEEWKKICQNVNHDEIATTACRGHLDMISLGSAWHPEMSRHMIEALPDPPYNFSGELDGCVLGVEESMNTRRRKIQCLLPPEVSVTSITVFPGMGGFEPGNNETWIADEKGSEKLEKPGRLAGSPYSNSHFCPDSIANPHPRFLTLVKNIKKRRGGSYKILVPVYKDVQTQQHPMWKLSLPESAASNRKLVDHAAMITPNPIKNHIYMDSFAFGMGTSCLQVTVGVTNIHEARYLYDQYTVIAPIVLALTASTPAYRGLLADTDTRWSVLEQGCDCRTADEEDPNSPNYIPKSRYSGVSLYIGDLMNQYDDVFNDTYAPINKDAFDYLCAEGIDPLLSRHFAHLWIRQPMVIYDNAVFIDNETRNDHFENLNSTNWNSVRFKPPPSDNLDMPYRVELRTAEIQLSDFENACMASWSAVFARAAIENKWELYLPMSMNDMNMKRSWQREAVNTQKFWFRRRVDAGSTDEYLQNDDRSLFIEMTMDQIIGGWCAVKWIGLVPLTMQYATQQYESGKMSCAAVIRFSVFCEFLKARASGEVPTCAKYLRSLMTSHLHYNQDSVVTPSMAARAMTAAALVGAGIFKNDCASIKPHLGRFVLDANPIYSDEWGCILKNLRKGIYKYEGLNGGYTQFKTLRETLIEQSVDSSVKSSTKSITYGIDKNSDVGGDATTSAASDKIEENNNILDLNESIDKKRADLSSDSIESNSRANRGDMNGGEDSSNRSASFSSSRSVRSSEFTSRLQVMIECREKGNELDCTIHGIHKGLFSPAGFNGGYKEPFGFGDEWQESHDVKNGEPNVNCHDILKSLLENGADLSKLTPDGFPCRKTLSLRSTPSNLYMTVANDAEFDGGLGPFVPTLEAKSKVWVNYQQQLENEEVLPEWQARKRMVMRIPPNQMD